MVVNISGKSDPSACYAHAGAATAAANPVGAHRTHSSISSWALQPYQLVGALRQHGMDSGASRISGRAQRLACSPLDLFQALDVELKGLDLSLKGFDSRVSDDVDTHRITSLP
ncbi:hypothetical protein [Delftia sp. PE138]|uniref:hypothetical protein n=1 Tax=Delftia sp. PE138 TaxID=1812483 RepID=UPI001BAF1D87|nr:hypothetical protein [Delftia sp. PE138]